MRHDTAGFFWDDTPVAKVLKEKIKRTPPERTWESPDYLPYLEEAQQFNVPLYEGMDLYEAQRAGEELTLDVEVYPNYFMCGMQGDSGKIAYFEMDEDFALDGDKLRWILENFCTYGFNSLHYDMVMLALVLAGRTCEDLQWATEQIIHYDQKASKILNRLGAKPIKANHFDLIEVAPLRANLKIYNGRLHGHRMQDLPFPPGTILSPDQKLITRWYNVNDLESTRLMRRELREQIKLRQTMSMEYRVDLRSKSDAQIAEAVISHEITRLNGQRPQWPEIRPGAFRYQPPAFLRYSSPLMNWAFEQVCTADFEVGFDGTVALPKQVHELKLEIGSGKYQMGIGGLHSSEQKRCYFSSEFNTIYDRDVTSYYPQLILNSGMYPEQLGRSFLQVYQRIVTRRVEAKARKDRTTAETLKITANGTFGKLGSPYSILHSPKQMIQVTVTGQLSLLMLIERLELAGIPVVSANTDGIVINCPNHLRPDYHCIIKQWEMDTNLVTEEAIYSAYYGRDVNNYIAVKKGGGIKAKGAYSDPWSDPDLAIFRFHKNPVNLICTEAVQKFLVSGTPVMDTVAGCKDASRFVTVRSVRGGAVKDGEYLGKSIRWYYAKDEEGEIISASNGHSVPRSKGARPLLTLPDALPEDLDLDWYVLEARSMLEALGLPANLG